MVFNLLRTLQAAGAFFASTQSGIPSQIGEEDLLAVEELIRKFPSRDNFNVVSCTRENVVLERSKGNNLAVGDVFVHATGSSSNRDEFSDDCTALYRKITSIVQDDINNVVIATTTFATVADAFPSGSYDNFLSEIPVEPTLNYYDVSNDRMLQTLFTTPSPTVTPVPNPICATLYNVWSLFAFTAALVFLPCFLPFYLIFGGGFRFCNFSGFDFPFINEIETDASKFP